MNKFLWIDVETTGLDPKINDPHQLAGFIMVDGVIKDEFNIECQPFDWSTVEDEALAISGLERGDLEGRMESVTAYESLNARLCKYVNKYDKKDKYVLAAYNANFDAQFVNSWFAKHGNPYFFGLCHGGAYFDPLTMALMAEVKAGKQLFFPNRKLEVVAKTLGVELGNAHNALADIRATREVAQKLWVMITG